MLDSSSGRQGPLCSRSYLTQAKAASKTCHEKGVLWPLPHHKPLPYPPSFSSLLGPHNPSSHTFPECTAFVPLPHLPCLVQPCWEIFLLFTDSLLTAVSGVDSSLHCSKMPASVPSCYSP